MAKMHFSTFAIVCERKIIRRPQARCRALSWQAIKDLFASLLGRKREHNSPDAVVRVLYFFVQHSKKGGGLMRKLTMIKRVSVERLVLSRESQILCMVAGANSIIYGEALLTTPNVVVNEDDALLAALAPLSSAATLAHS
jgi:hypothetical protein